MSAFDNEPTLRRAFADLREMERAAVPQFNALLAGNPPPGVGSGAASRRGFVLLFAILGVITAIAIARRPRPVATAQSIVEWRSPTDALLRTPAAQVLHSVPSLRSSVLDGPSATQ